MVQHIKASVVVLENWKNDVEEVFMKKGFSDCVKIIKGHLRTKMI